MFPLIKHFKEYNILYAFILASIFQTILLSLTLSTHDIFDEYETTPFLKYFFSALYIFIVTLLSYGLMYYIFGYGGGMII